jgi:hypothetical protein
VLITNKANGSDMGQRNSRNWPKHHGAKLLTARNGEKLQATPPVVRRRKRKRKVQKQQRKNPERVTAATTRRVAGRSQSNSLVLLKRPRGPEGRACYSCYRDWFLQSVATAHVRRCRRRPRSGNRWRGCRLDCGLTRCGRGGFWRARARNQR